MDPREKSGSQRNWLENICATAFAGRHRVSSASQQPGVHAGFVRRRRSEASGFGSMIQVGRKRAGGNWARFSSARILAFKSAARVSAPGALSQGDGLLGA